MRVRYVGQTGKPHSVITARLPHVTYLRIGDVLDTSDIVGEWLCSRFSKAFVEIETVAPAENAMSEGPSEAK